MARNDIKTIKIGRTRIEGESDRAGTATLTPVTTPDAQPSTYLVAVDERGREYFGGGNREGTIGGICKIRGGRWAVVAYRDRAHLHGGGTVTYLPDARTQTAAIRGLLRFYHHTDRGDMLNEPTQMSSSAQKYLMD